MYVFEGHDYSREPSDKDKSAFDELISGTFWQCIIRSLTSRYEHWIVYDEQRIQELS